MTISCPSVIQATIASSGNGFSLFSVKWAYAPLDSDVICVQYRLTGDTTWINANTKVAVDIYGNLVGGEQVIVANALPCTSYDVNIFNQCGSIAFQAVFVFPCKIYSNKYLLDNGIYNICGDSGTFLYSSEPFATGVTLYTDIGLTTTVNGYAYVTYAGAGNIFALNISTGVVGADLGFNCEGSYLIKGMLGNNSATICSGAIVDYYANSALGVGVIIYTDEARTIAATGFDFFLDVLNNIIYNVNNATGAITADSGVTCTAAGNDYQFALTQTDVSNGVITKLYTVGAFEKGAIMYTDYAMTTPLTGYNYIALPFSETIYTISKTTGEVGCIATPC